MQKVGGRRRVAHGVNEVAAADIIRIIMTSMVHVLDDLSRTVEGVLSFECRSIGMTTRPIRINLPVLSRDKSYGPPSGVIRARAVIVGPDGIAGSVITGTRPLVIAAIDGRIVFVLHRPDPASAQRRVVPFVIGIWLAIRTACLREWRRRSTVSFRTAVGFF